MLGFSNKYYSAGTFTIENPFKISPVDKLYLKCDCVDGSIVNGTREQNLSVRQRLKTMENPL